MSNDQAFEIGSGNVYEDLGFPDAKERFIKSSMAIAMHREIVRRGLTNSEAAVMMGIPEAHFCNSLRGRLDDFSIDDLIRLLNALGLDFAFSIVPKVVAS